MTTTEIRRPVLFSGENPGMTLYIPGTQQAAAIVSYWHCTDSPYGVGHALVLWLAEETASVREFGQGCILTDNPELAQLLVTRLTRHFPEFDGVPVADLPYLEARCEHTYDGERYQVIAQSPEIQVKVEWSSMLDRKQVIWPQFPAGEAAFDLTTVICPCQVGLIQLNGERIAGEVMMGQNAEGKLSSSAFLAFAETWIGSIDSL